MLECDFQLWGMSRWLVAQVLCGHRVMDKMPLITLLGGFSSTGNGAVGLTGVTDKPFIQACASFRRQRTGEFASKVGQIGIDREWRVG